MSNKILVPSQQSVGWDVVRVSGEEEYSLYSSSGNSFSSSTSPCQVSSSSALRRSPSRKKQKEDTKEVTGAPTINNESVPEDYRSSQEEQVDSAGVTMGYDAAGSYRSRNTHRRVSSPHPDGTVRKSNKPQMERRRRQRINESVNELRKCISEVFKVDPSRHDKLEKADILELTVKYFHFIRSKCSAGDTNSENKPIRFENKKLSDDFSATDRFDNGMKELRYNNINEQPLTLIIQTLPQNYQFGMRDQCLVGFNGNSIGAQPSSLLPNNSPPVIQLNITNNITNPGLDGVQCQMACQPDNAFGSPIYPDTTTKDVQHEISKYGIDKGELSQVEGCIGEPTYGAIDKMDKKIFHNNKKVMSPNRETLNAKRVSLGRPIAPKPPVRADNVAQPHAKQHNNQNENEQVWRPWDANRKLLKPHIVR